MKTVFYCSEFIASKNIDRKINTMLQNEQAKVFSLSTVTCMQCRCYWRPNARQVSGDSDPTCSSRFRCLLACSRKVKTTQTVGYKKKSRRDKLSKNTLAHNRINSFDKLSLTASGVKKIARFVRSFGSEMSSYLLRGSRRQVLGKWIYN